MAYDHAKQSNASDFFPFHINIFYFALHIRLLCMLDILEISDP